MNKKTLTALLSVLLAVVLGIFGIFQNDSPASVPETPTLSTTAATQADLLDIQGSYTSKEDVALYIHLYGKLPDNFITKDEARKFGWDGGVPTVNFGPCALLVEFQSHAVFQDYVITSFQRLVLCNFDFNTREMLAEYLLSCLGQLVGADGAVVECKSNLC